MKDSVVNEQSEVTKRRNVMVAKENEPTTNTWALKRLCFIFGCTTEKGGWGVGWKRKGNCGCFSVGTCVAIEHNVVIWKRVYPHARRVFYITTYYVSLA